MKRGTWDTPLADYRLPVGGKWGSGAARVTPHTLVGGYLTSESSTATTVARQCITVKAGYTGVAPATQEQPQPSLNSILTHLHRLGLGYAPLEAALRLGL